MIVSGFNTQNKCFSTS